MQVKQLVHELVDLHRTMRLQNKSEVYTLINYLSTSKGFDAKDARDLHKLYYLEEHPTVKVEDGQLKKSLNYFVDIDSTRLGVSHLFKQTLSPLSTTQYYVIQSLAQENLLKRAIGVRPNEIIIYKDNTSILVDKWGNIKESINEIKDDHVDIIPIWQSEEVRHLKLNTFDLFDLDKYYKGEIIYQFDDEDYTNYRKKCYNIIDTIVEMRNTTSTEQYYVNEGYEQSLNNSCDQPIGIKLSGLFDGKYQSLPSSRVENYSPQKNQTIVTHIISLDKYSKDKSWCINEEMILCDL